LSRSAIAVDREERAEVFNNSSKMRHELDRLRYRSLYRRLFHRAIRRMVFQHLDKNYCDPVDWWHFLRIVEVDWNVDESYFAFHRRAGHVGAAHDDEKAGQQTSRSRHRGLETSPMMKHAVPILKAFSVALLFYMVLTFVLAVLGKLPWMFFWVSAAFVAFCAYVVIPRVRKRIQTYA
jgi:hypothetical protein